MSVEWDLYQFHMPSTTGLYVGVNGTVFKVSERFCSV